MDFKYYHSLSDILSIEDVPEAFAPILKGINQLPPWYVSPRTTSSRVCIKKIRFDCGT